MKLQPPDPNIGERDGFAKSDIFKLQDFGDRLGTLVESLDGPSVLMLDGPWGCGKSTFVRQWTGMLRQRGNAVINFDAFANDHHDDAFFALAGELYAYDEGKAAARDKLVTPLVKIAKALLPLAGRVTLKAATQGIVSMDDISRVRKASVEDGDVRDELIKQRLTGVAEDRQCIYAFRKLLSEFARELTGQTAEAESQMQPTAIAGRRKLVFVVDELDRCRPPFALNLLERIKHVFSVENICFVLVAHLCELAKVVERSYGITDGKGGCYLEKFYQLRVHLPEPSHGHRRGRRERYLEHLAQAMDAKGDDEGVFELITEVLESLGDAYDLSLRTLEQVMLNMSLVFRATSGRSLRFASIVGGLCVMKVVDDELYTLARRGQLSDEKALAFMRLGDAKAWEGREGSSEWHRDWWVFATAEDGSEQLEKVGAKVQNVVRHRGQRHDIVPMVCRYIDEFHQRD